MHKSVNIEDLIYKTKNIICIIQGVMALIWFALGIIFCPGSITLSVIIKLLLLICSVYLLSKNNILNGIYILSFPFVIQSIFENGLISYYIAAFALILGIINLIKDKKARYITAFALNGVLIIFMLVIGTYFATSVPKGIATGLMNNYAIDNCEEDYYVWPEEIRNKIDYSNIPVMAHNREYAKKVLLEAAGGDINTFNKYAFSISFASINNRKKDTIIITVNNFIDYLIAPLTFIDNCEGYGVSITGTRLKELYGKNTYYGSLYARISVGLLIVNMALGISMLIRKKISINKTLALSVIWALLCAVFANTAFDYMFFVPIYILINNEFGKIPLKREDAR